MKQQNQQKWNEAMAHTVYENELKKRGYRIDVRDRASTLVMNGKNSIGRFQSYVEAVEAAMNHDMSNVKGGTR